MFQEKFIYHIWDAQHLQKSLKTISGNSLEIIYQGRWNTDFGPDFRDAVIKINSIVLRGDVEIHLNSRDWVNHHHHEDPAYNNTILHVVYNHDDHLNMTISEQGGKIEILEICNLLDQEIEKLLSSYKDLPFIPKPEFCSFFAGLTGDFLIPLLSRIGQNRLENKIKRFRAELYFKDYDQILYQGIMEALGYSKNKFQMLLFSNQITFRKLQSALENDFQEKKILFLLLHYSNLLEKLPENLKNLCPVDSGHQINKCLAAVTPPLKWELFRIRPGNHPAVRMIQASIILHKSFPGSLLRLFLNLFAEPEMKFSLKNFRYRLTDLFLSTDLKMPSGYRLGINRIDDILINILLPVLILYFQNQKYPDLADLAAKIYQTYPGLALNHVINYMKKFMLPDQFNQIRKKAILQQGLIGLYFSFCKHHNCGLCKEYKVNMISRM